MPVCSLLCTGAQWFDRVPTSTGWNFLILWPLNSGMCGSPCSRAPCCACYPVIASAPLHACHPDALPSLLARLSYCELRPSFALSRVLLPQVRSRLIKGGGVRALQLSKLQWKPSCGRARPSLSMVSKLFARAGAASVLFPACSRRVCFPRRMRGIRTRHVWRLARELQQQPRHGKRIPTAATTLPDDS